MMNKYIRSVILFDKTVTFFLTEPFYNTICHCDTLLK
jgi:hypothetical protein